MRRGEEIDVVVSAGAVAHASPHSSVDDALSFSRWLFVNLDSAATVGDFALVTFLLKALAAVAAAPGRHQRNLVGEGLMAMSSAVWSDPDIVGALINSSSGGGGGGGGRQAVLSDINKRDPVTGQQPLHIATHLGHRVAVCALIFYGADVNAVVDPVPPTSGASGSRMSDLAFPKTLLRGMSALHWAALRGYLEIVQDLIMGGADLNARVSHSGETALHLAARRGEEAVVDVLLDAGCKWSISSSSNLTPLDLAALSNHPGTLSAFLRRGINPNAKNPLGYTALHQAAYNNSCDTLRLLLECSGGAGVNTATDATGYTPLHVAALFSTTSGRSGTSAATTAGSSLSSAASLCSAVRTIGRYGGAHLRVDAADGKGWTPLRTACVNLREEAVRDLLDIGADETLVEDLLPPSSEQLFAKTIRSSGGGGNAASTRTTTAGATDDSRRAESIARVRAMLAAAPADRAWRRRGWLAMLRTAKNNRRAVLAVAAAGSGDDSPRRRSLKRMSAPCDSEGDDGEAVSAAHSGTAAAAAAAAAKASRGGGGERGSGAGAAARAAAAAGGGHGFAQLVETLTALEDENVFRRIALFL
ncbi:unnamed protein product [Pylaiella littoralis]